VETAGYEYELFDETAEGAGDAELGMFAHPAKPKATPNTANVVILFTNDLLTIDTLLSERLHAIVRLAGCRWQSANELSAAPPARH
jgi:hypothetical protein